MPSAQHEVNEVNQVPQDDSILKGVANQMMNEVFDYQGSRVMKNAQGPAEALTGSAALDKAQKMMHGEAKGELEFTPIFPKKGDVDTCAPNLQKHAMIEQFADKKGHHAGGLLQKGIAGTSLDSDRR